MQPSEPRLFSYGTLQSHRVQQALFGRRVSATPDTLAGFRIGTLRYCDAPEPPSYKVLEPDPRAPLVNGMLLDLEPADLVAADAYEGPGYRRIAAVFGSGRIGWVYVRA